MDTHIEYMVRKHKDASDIAKQVLYTVLALIISIVIMIFSRYTFGLWFVVIAGVWYLVYRLISGLDREFEYILTNDELDIDTIISKRTRKRILTLKVREFMICAPVGDKRFAKEYVKNSGIKQYIYAASDPKSETSYFADFHLNAQRVRLVFNPPYKMVEAMKQYNPKNIYLPQSE